MTTAHLYVDAGEWPDTVDVIGSGDDGKWAVRLLDHDGLHVRVTGTPDELRWFGTHFIDIADEIDGAGDE